MNALEIKGLRKVYKNGTVAIDNVDLSVASGDFLGFIGPNGAGKSTLINIVSSLTSKTSGIVNICGYDLDKQTVNAKKCLGVVPQEINFNILESPFEIIVNQARFYGLKLQEAKYRAKKLLMELDLWGKHDSITQSLSGGMKRRVMIARSLVHNPKLLLLDEPTVGIDVEQRRVMWDYINRINAEGTTIILTTHYLEEAEKLCNKYSFILSGKIISNATSDNLYELHSKSNLEDILLEYIKVDKYET